MMEHKSVLRNETIDLLNIKPSGIYVDGTLGRGGHSKLLLSKLTDGHLYAFDKDLDAIKESQEVLQDYKDKVTIIHDDFCHLKTCLNEKNVFEIDGFMMDLGVSSPQFDDPSRGFSYRYDARLDMRMDQTQALSAYEVVNTYSYEELVSILFRYGEEKYAKQIVRSIERERAKKPIETTFELVDAIKKALPNKVLNKKGHPAKQTFQALRIEVNHELTSLEEGLKDACSLLKTGGRGAVITFHSLEDRIVKTVFKDLSSTPYVDPKIPLTKDQMKKASFALVTRKPVVSGRDELDENHRSHSAKLRVIERIQEDEETS